MTSRVGLTSKYVASVRDWYKGMDVLMVHQTHARDGVQSLKKNQSAPRPSEHPPVMGEKMSKRLGGIKGCKYKTSLLHKDPLDTLKNSKNSDISRAGCT